jgi:hypothetical protein
MYSWFWAPLEIDEGWKVERRGGLTATKSVGRVFSAMTNDQLLELIRSLETGLQPHLQRSAPLRTAVGLLGQWLTELANAADERDFSADPSGSAAAESSSVHPRGSAEQTAAAENHAIRLGVAPSAPPPKRTTAILPLKIGDAVIHIPTQGTTEEIGRARVAAQDTAAAMLQSGYQETDLELVMTRVKLKARACEVAVAKRKSEAEGDAAGVAAHILKINELVAQAKELPHCFLWTLWRERPLPDFDLVLTAAKCYDNVAAAAAFMVRVDEAVARGQRADDIVPMKLLAEACSALRVVLSPTWLGEDQDQSEVYQWLRRATQSRRIYIDRYMTMADAADPKAHEDLATRIRTADSEFAQVGQHEKDVKKHLNTTKYACTSLPKCDADERSHHWKKLSEALQLLQKVNVPPTDPRVLEYISGVLTVPRPENTADMSGFNLVESALETAAKVNLEREARAAREALEDDNDDSPREWGPEVLKVREWLRGQRIVMVGGDRRTSAVDRLKDAFEVSEVDWVELQEHGTSTPVRSAITRAPCVAVFILVRLTGHLHGERTDEWAKEAGVTCVWLKAGYNPQRIAHDSLEQVAALIGSRAKVKI